MNKQTGTISTDKVNLYDQLIAENPSIERKGKTMPYTSLNGHMFSFLAKDGKMGLRLSKKDRELFIDKFDSKLMEQHGRTMKEYVLVPDKLLKDTKTLSKYLRKSYDYILTLEPKPTKKK